MDVLADDLMDGAMFSRSRSGTAWGGPRIWGLGIQNFSKCNFFWQPKVQIVAHN
jgi:hypothetical protein